MAEEKQIDPRDQATRKVLRTVGPIVLLFGVILVVVSLFDFFQAFGGFEPPKLVWLPFVGMPLMFVGGVMTMFGYMGAVARYQAGEIAPVGKDTFNYLADGAKDGVRVLARAVGEGLGRAGADGPAKTVVLCPKCTTENDGDAMFCDRCGASLQKNRPCPQCREMNDSDASFCDACGARLS